MEWALNNIEGIVAVITAIIAVASAVANLTKTDHDNQVIAKVSKFVDMLALNFKK